MSVITKNYLDQTGLQAYDNLIKAWVNGTGDKAKSEVIFRTVNYDSDNIYFYHKAGAVKGTDTADVTVPLAGSDVTKALAEISAIVTALGGTMAATSPYTIDLSALTTTAKTSLVAAINELDSDIATLNGNDSTTGSVAKSIKDAIGALDTAADVGVASKSGKAVTITGSVKEEDGIVKKGAATDIVLADVASTGAAEDVAIADAGEKITATNVEGALAELADAIATATNAGKVTCETTNGGEGSDTLKTYSFYQGVLSGDDAAAKAAKKIVDVNIPKDYVVRDADVKTVTTADDPYQGAVVGEKYIDLEINTSDGSGSGTVKHLYIPFKELMDAVKGSVGTEVTVAVANDNTISATINKIAATKIIYEEGTGGAADVTVKNALDTINGDANTAGSINKAKADVIGTASDTANADTIKGAKAYTDAAIDALDTSSDVAIATYDSTNDKIVLVNGIAETNGVITAGSGDGIEITKIATSSINALFGNS